MDDETVFRVLVPGAVDGDEYVLKKLRLEAQAAFRHPHLYDAMMDRQFAFAILVQDEKRKAKLDEVIKAEALPTPVRVEVFCVAGPTNLKEHIE